MGYRACVGVSLRGFRTSLAVLAKAPEMTKMPDEPIVKPVRHLLGLSGGKDSSALAIYLRDKVPEIG